MSQAVVTALLARFPEGLEAMTMTGGDHGVLVPAQKLVEVATFLRDTPEMSFELPVFCTATDRLDLIDEGDRFEITYMLRSLKHRHQVFLKVRVPESAPTLPTLATLWTGFNWLEREVFDMYGVRFDGHPDLRRIYMYDQFQGHPLRKDYPKDKRQPLVRRDWTDEPLSIDQTRAIKKVSR